MARQTGFLANVLNVAPLVFRFQFNPDLMSDKKSYQYDPVEFGRWNLLKDSTSPGGIEGLIGLDLQSIGPKLINTKQLKAKEGEHRVVSIDFQLDGSPDLPPEVRSRLGSITPDLAVLRSFMYPSYALTDLPKVLTVSGLATTKECSMSVSSSSRYANLPVFDAPDAAGVSHPTIAMRLATTTPPAATYQRTVAVLDTLETLAWACYHSSTAWWRIADANPPVFPLDWHPGDVVVIPLAPDSGLVQRTRKF